jgi:hypothetical protein
MQISLSQDQISTIKNRYFKNLNDAASNEYKQADFYSQLHKLVGEEGFVSFLTQYFNYTPEKIEQARELLQARQMFVSRRLWMRVGGYKGVKKLVTVVDEDRRQALITRINTPKGVVNYSLADLDRMIKSEDLQVSFFESTRSMPRGDHQQMISKIRKLERSIQNLKKSRKTRRNRKSSEHKSHRLLDGNQRLASVSRAR